MTNDLDENNFFFKHYSADEFYILQETIAFFLAYMFLLCLSLYVAYSLHIRQLYHTTFKLYLASLCVEYLALIAQLIYWVDYGYSGIPIANWKNLGRFLDFASQVIFVILLILMGKGYTITRGRISVGGTIKIIVFSIVFICVTIAMIIWEIVSFDPALVLYLYDSLPGYALIGVRILSWIWFLYGIGFTLKHFPEKMSFYVPFLIVYTVWFWFGNTVALIAIDTIPVWIKEKVVQGCMLFVTFFGHLVFLILTWPTMANKTFPYHIKTTQVGAMDPQPRTTGPGVAIETGMGGGAYTPNGVQVPFEPDGEKRFIEMFTTDRSSNSVHTASRKD
ncbi:transmembrane protein 145-like [Watersipora subatra]|uniref:transmembrane protein 145-like n=1 Tax=Watersipora subatra TaxID=2589382 RepID=UPI00355C940D